MAADQPDRCDVEILQEQGAVYVMNKPGGLLTQGPPGVDSLEFRLRQLLKRREEKEGNIYLGVPHRLDRPVSGAIVMVRNVRAAQRISQQLQDKTVTKVYWAVVEGTVENDGGTWVDWMRKLPDEPKSEIVPPSHPEAKEAILHFKVRARTNGLTWLEIQLETGRTHQIRLQCASRGTPIVGDELYGSTQTFGEPTLDSRRQGIALHARRLAFNHPILPEKVDVLAPFDHRWKQLGLITGIDEFK